jgi:curved DNA-binding protein CbpA
MDLSRILHVPPDADKATITKAFRKLALNYHPDKARDNSKLKFQHVGAAYEILMAKPGPKGTKSGTDKYAGMSAEDLAWLKNIKREQEKKYGSFKFSFESDSAFTDEEETGLLKECSICSGPCSVKEFVAPPPFDPLGFTSWPTPCPVSRISPPAQQRPSPAPRPSPTSFSYPPASARPEPTQSSSAAQYSEPSLTDADNIKHSQLRFQDNNSNDFLYPN